MNEKKIKLATVWLDGCSGCHMSFLDMDERLLELAEKVEVVYSPLVDAKEFPEEVDVTLVEGAVSTEEDLHKIRLIRQRTKILVAFGDCAVTGNVPAMRNRFHIKEVMERVYEQNATQNHKPPVDGIPTLLPRVRPVHEVVKVDVYLPGCPPRADAIYFVLTELLEGRIPDTTAVTRFGA
ncbi:MAG: NADP oxidoreductase [Armatimonadetes bacterium]|nr:NADP oxidoreductase [Armatimonadota bacterium]MCX7968874.1 NADP oxidoreductase [Armatimonadota bacterium]MDW8143648.1 NADP oxidoreductase [Armatimonadota bacterium]